MSDAVLPPLQSSASTTSVSTTSASPTARPARVRLGAPPAVAPRAPKDATGPGGVRGDHRGRPSGALRLLLLRLHFYAGVLVAPFLVVAALTGLAYTATPQIDHLLYGDQLLVRGATSGPTRPLSAQVAAARVAHPEGSLAAVITPAGQHRTTQVVLTVPGLGEKQRTVYVNPYSARVQGDLVTWYGSPPATTWLDDLHRNLHLGAWGRSYSELAASWLWVLVAGGLVLWLDRWRRTRARGQRRGLKPVVVPDVAATGRRSSMSWHAATGVWLVVGLMFLSATGLTWSRFAGAHFTGVLDAMHAHAPQLDTTLAPHPPSALTSSAAAAGDLPFDAVLAGARRAGYDGPVEIDLPTDVSGSLTADAGAAAWQVTQTDRRWPVRLGQVAIDPATSAVVSQAPWDSFPLLAKASKLGIAGHMGLLFGPLNQFLLAALALGLLTVTFFGYRMWWQRRPTRSARRALAGAAPPRGAWREVPCAQLAVLVTVTGAVAWALPLLGASLAAFLLIDAGRGLHARRRAGATSLTAT